MSLDYSLIDCGGQEKLERFGQYVLRRPEPQAIWAKQSKDSIWNQWDAFYTRPSGDAKGGWLYKSKPIQSWWIHYGDINIKLQCTSFGHLGIFPEQQANWEELAKFCKSKANLKMLNLFAYTGVASLVGNQYGAEVYHVDAVPSMLTWAKSNMEASHLKDIRWVAEDVFKFVTREVNRNKEYQVIVLDPPAYGRGPKGEKWLLEDQLDDLIQKCAALLTSNGNYLLLNMYSMGYSTTIAKQLLQLHFQNWKINARELIIKAESGVQLPLGITGVATRQ